ncbi:DUF4368 domain-containing protein [Streptococcus mitis]|uniref:DUF4368 domain-containing protein n=1 Tax=Streptococcus mitis TaxID=28037 RepID=UPI0020008322|nr:DUF4368 domain-containing protein [Streptococcus mitis]
MGIILKYTPVSELIVEMVIKMIDKIIIHKRNGTKRNRIIQIDIYYSFIRKLNNKKSHPKMTFFKSHSCQNRVYVE